jgi:hypothetical protein
MECIKKENKLHCHPILVNEDFEIISGQHRFEVAKRLKVPIYYVVDECTDEHILQANWAQKKCTSREGLEFYVKKNNTPSYRFLQEVMHLCGISLKAAVYLVSGITHIAIKKIRAGTYEIKDIPQERKVVESYLDVRGHLLTFDIEPKAMFNNAQFCSAFRKMYDHGAMWDLFKKKVNIQWHKIKHQPTSDRWLENLLAVYNFKNSYKLNIDE